MTIVAFRKWKATRTRIPWDELEATVIEVAALEQVLKESPEPMLKRAMRAEAALNDLDVRVRLAIADLRAADIDGLKEAVATAIAQLQEAVNRIVKLAALKEKR